MVCKLGHDATKKVYKEGQMKTQRIFIVLILAIGLLLNNVSIGLADPPAPDETLAVELQITDTPTDTPIPPTNTPVPPTNTPVQEYTLTVSSAHGTVTKDPSKATYHLGDVVTLTAIPSAGWSFAYWSGGLSGSSNPASLVITQSTIVGANYSQNEFTLTVSAANGQVFKDPDKAAYHSGDVVKLTAVPAPGWSFGFWSGGVTGTANPVTVTITGNMSVTAKFNKISNPSLPTSTPNIFNPPSKTPTGVVLPSETDPTSVTQPTFTATPTLAAFVQPTSTPVVPKFPEEAPTNNFKLQLTLVGVLGAIAVVVLVWSVLARRWRPR